MGTVSADEADESDDQSTTIPREADFLYLYSTSDGKYQVFWQIKIYLQIINTFCNKNYSSLTSLSEMFAIYQLFVVLYIE